MDSNQHLNNKAITEAITNWRMLELRCNQVTAWLAHRGDISAVFLIFVISADLEK